MENIKAVRKVQNLSADTMNEIMAEVCDDLAKELGYVTADRDADGTALWDAICGSPCWPEQMGGFDGITRSPNGEALVSASSRERAIDQYTDACRESLRRYVAAR